MSQLETHNPYYKKIGFLNTNMGIMGLRENIADAVFGTLAFFGEYSSESIYKRSDIEKTLLPFLDDSFDILGFSEIFGEKQLSIVKSAFEKRGYNVHATPAFNYWARDGEKIAIYNVIGTKDDFSVLTESQFTNKRRFAGIFNACKHATMDIVDTFHIPANRMKNTYLNHVHGKLLDGAMTSIDIGDMVVTFVHIHSDNTNLDYYFSKHIVREKPQVFIGDFNIRDYTCIEKLLEGYTKDLPETEKTYCFAKGIKHLPGLFPQPDQIFSKGVEVFGAESVYSLSDHNAITAKIKNI